MTLRLFLYVALVVVGGCGKMKPTVSGCGSGAAQEFQDLVRVSEFVTVDMISSIEKTGREHIHKRDGDSGKLLFEIYIRFSPAVGGQHDRKTEGVYQWEASWVGQTGSGDERSLGPSVVPFRLEGNRFRAVTDCAPAYLRLNQLPSGAPLTWTREQALRDLPVMLLAEGPDQAHWPISLSSIDVSISMAGPVFVTQALRNRLSSGGAVERKAAEELCRRFGNCYPSDRILNTPQSEEVQFTLQRARAHAEHSARMLLPALTRNDVSYVLSYTRARDLLEAKEVLAGHYSPEVRKAAAALH